MENEINDLKTEVAVQSTKLEHFESVVNTLSKGIESNKGRSDTFDERFKSIEIANSGHVGWLNSLKWLILLAVSVLLSIFASNVYFSIDQSSDIRDLRNELAIEMEKSCDLWNVYYEKEILEYIDLTVRLNSELEEIKKSIADEKNKVNEGNNDIDRTKILLALLDSRNKKQIDLKRARKHESDLESGQRECK